MLRQTTWNYRLWNQLRLVIGDRPVSKCGAFTPGHLRCLILKSHLYWCNHDVELRKSDRVIYLFRHGHEHDIDEHWRERVRADNFQYIKGEITKTRLYQVQQKVHRKKRVQGHLQNMREKDHCPNTLRHEIRETEEDGEPPK